MRIWGSINTPALRHQRLLLNWQLPVCPALSAVSAALCLRRERVLGTTHLVLLLSAVHRQGGDQTLRLDYTQYGLYYLLTCGGFTGQQDVGAAAAAYRALPNSHPQYAATPGLIQLRLELLQVRAAGQQLIKPRA